jgi:hypothetical protein
VPGLPHPSGELEGGHRHSWPVTVSKF